MIDFLGRESEIAVLDRAILADKTRQIVTIFGQGGIGKTRLLREIQTRYSSDSSREVAEIIDFDVPVHDLLHLLASSLNRTFTYELQPYTNATYLRQQVNNGVLDAGRLSAAALDTEAVLIQCINAITNTHRLIFLFDTVEKASSRTSFADMLRLLARVNNVAIVFAGRQQQKGSIEEEPLNQELTRLFGSGATLRTLLLGPFDRQTLFEYVALKQTQQNVDLEPAWQRILALLADGRPVLVDLAVELGNNITSANWLRELAEREAELQFISQSNTPEARKQLANVRERFGRELVQDSVTIRTSLDMLKILLVYVTPLGREHIAYILDFTPDQASHTFDEAAGQAAFKLIDANLLALHDVVQDLLRLFIIPEVDSDGERRTAYLSRAIEVLEHDSNALAHKIAALEVEKDVYRGTELYLAIRSYQQVRLRIVDYTFQLDPESGVQRLEEELKQIERYYGVSADFSALLETIQTYLPTLKDQAPDVYVQAYMLLADQFVRIEQYAKAKEIYDDLEVAIQASSLSRRAEITRRRGAIEMGIGRVRKAIEYFSEAADIASSQGDHVFQTRALISCAWAARNYGALFRPTKYYLEALRRVSDPSIDPVVALELKATALNGLSYVYAIERRVEARDLLEQAIEIRRSLGVRGKHALGQSYSTAGEVYCELGDPHTALTYLELAEEVFRELDADQPHDMARAGSANQLSQWFGKVFSARGRAYSALWQLSKSHTERAAYLRSAEETLLLAVRQAIAADLPRALQRLGFVYAADPQRNQQAVETWGECYRRAYEFGDLFMEFNVVGNLAQMAIQGYVSSTFPDSEAFNHWYDEYRVRSEGARFDVLKSRFDVYRGALALREGNVERAFQNLNSGLKGLIDRQFDVSYSFDWQIDFLEKTVFPSASSVQVQEIGNRLLQDWMAAERGVALWSRFEHWMRWSA